MSVTFIRHNMTYHEVIEDGYTCHDPNGPSLNVSNTNAFYLQELLGLEPDYSGEIEAADLLGRVLVAMGLGGHDVGVPPVEGLGENGARWIDCGRREGYADERLSILKEIAEEAIAAGELVGWG